MIKADGKDLIFLVSAPRAGSTLLGAMLGTSPKALCPPEVWVQLLLTVFDRNGAHADASFDHDLALNAFLEVAGAEGSGDARRSFALSIYNRILATKPGSTLLVDKTPRYYHILDSLAALWPEARFIWIQRNPLDIVASCKNTWAIDVAEQMGEIITPHSYDTTLSFDLLLKFFGGTNRGHVIRYEDLTENPEKILKGLCRELNLAFAKEMLDYGENLSLVSGYRASNFGDKKILQHSSVHRHSIDRWRQSLDPGEVKTVLTTLGSHFFVAQGYRAELSEACNFAKIPEQDLCPDGLWRRNLDKGNSTPASANESASFTIARTVRRQREDLLALRSQHDARVKELSELSVSTDTLKNARNLLQAQLADLQGNFAAVEKDRIERGELIEQQGRKITKLEAEFDARLKELKSLYGSAEAFKNERNLLRAQLADIHANFNAVEKDRIERGQLIEQQGRKITELEAEFDTRLKELKSLYGSAEAFKNERNLLQAQLSDLQGNFSAVEKDRIERGQLIEQLGQKLTRLEAEFDSRLKELKSLYVSAEKTKNERNLLQAQLADLQTNFTAAEKDRNERGLVIERQGARTTELERLVWLTEQDRDYWRKLGQPKQG